MLTSERTSFIKKKTLGIDGFLQHTYFAVYPFEIQYLKDVRYNTAIYFQKNYQILGQLPDIIPPQQKGAKHHLTSLANLVPFRLFTEKNVVYKWSIYRHYDTGEQQFIESGTINLKEAVNNFVIPKNSQAMRSEQSLMQLGLLKKQIRLKFPSIGLILSFCLLVSQEVNQIRQIVINEYLQPNISVNLNPLPSQLNVEYSHMPGSSRQNAVPYEKSNSLENNSHKQIPLHSHQSSSELKQLQISDHIQEKDESHLIGQASNEEHRNQLDDLILNREREERKKEPLYDSLEIKHGGDYLKLDSDQGKIRQKIDIKLEENELGPIEEEERQSNKDSASNAVVTHFKHYETKMESPKKVENLEVPNEDKAVVGCSKKMIVLLLILLSIIVGLGVKKSSSKKPRKKLK